MCISTWCKIFILHTRYGIMLISTSTCYLADYYGHLRRVGHWRWHVSLQSFCYHMLKKWKLAKDQSCRHLKEVDSFATASILDTAWCKRKITRAAQCQRGIALSSIIVLYPNIMSNDTSTSIYTTKYFCKTEFTSVVGNIFIFIPSLSLSCSSVTLKYWLVFSLYLSCYLTQCQYPMLAWTADCYMLLHNAAKYVLMNIHCIVIVVSVIIAVMLPSRLIVIQSN